MAFSTLLVSPAGGDETVDLVPSQSPDGTLAGWKWFSEKQDTSMGDVWRLSPEGVLSCKGTPRGYIYTEKDYINLKLTLQWRWPPGHKPGKGGVLVRMTGPDKIWPKSLEAQINTGSAGDLIGLDGYEVSGPADRTSVVEHDQFGRLTFVKTATEAEKPAGEWNQYEIVVHGTAAKLILNGKEVCRAGGCDVTPGKICLTAEGDPIEFRNVRLTVSSTGE